MAYAHFMKMKKTSLQYSVLVYSILYLQYRTVYSISRQNSTFFRSFSYNEKSVLIIIFTYNIEVLNMIVTSTTAAVVALRALGPIPVLVAQVDIALVESGVTLVFVLGFAISGLKLLFLTHFAKYFS
jgi:hypothetical protein